VSSSSLRRSAEGTKTITQTKGEKIPRTYVVHLQHKVQELEEELRALSQEEYESPDADIMARSAGYVRFNENDEGRYLGPSSGIAVRVFRQHQSS